MAVHVIHLPLLVGDFTVPIRWTACQEAGVTPVRSYAGERAATASIVIGGRALPFIFRTILR